MKSEFQETIDRISRARHNAILGPSLPGDVANDVPDFVLEPEDRSEYLGRDRQILDDTIVHRLVNVLESYRGDVSEWSDAEPELSWRDQLPSSMTMFLFGLGVALVIGMNIFVLHPNSSPQQQAVSNLGGAVVLMLAGISLFYDRTVRGIGNDQIRYESGRRVELVSEQISSLAALYGQWVIEWKQREGNLRFLNEEIEKQQAASDESKSVRKRLEEECQDWLEKRIAFEEQADGQDRRLNQIRAELEFASRKINGLDQEIRTKTEQVSSLREQRNQMRDEILQLDQQRSELAETEDRLRREHEANERQRKRERESLDREIDTRTTTVRDLRSENETLANDKSELLLEIEMLRSEFDRNVSISTQQLTDLRNSIQDAQAERAMVLEDIENQKSVMQQLERNRQEIESSVLELDTRIDAQRLESQDLDEKIADQRERVLEREQTLDALERSRVQRLDEMQSQVSELDARIQDRTETIQGLEVEVEQWNGDRKTLFNELERLAAIKSAMEFSVDGLAERLEQRSSELRKKTMQVNEVAARLEALSNTVRALGGEGKEKPTSIGIDVSGGTTKSSAIRPIPFVPEASPSIDATIDGPNKIEGPHFKKADLLRLMDTLDKLDDLTQLGLS
ncbi:MAG: hypothetical protein WCI02_12340 [Planctomycetota bacterium]|jgi:myosin heavy subunit